LPAPVLLASSDGEFFSELYFFWWHLLLPEIRAAAFRPGDPRIAKAERLAAACAARR
jgi:hypothetical protein